jgi:hypothetical protein
MANGTRVRRPVSLPPVERVHMSVRITTDDHLTADPNDGVHNAGVVTTDALGPAATSGRFR